MKLTPPLCDLKVNGYGWGEWLEIHFFKIHIGKTTSQVKKFEIAQFCIFSQYFHLTIQGPVVQWVKDNAIHRKKQKKNT